MSKITLFIFVLVTATLNSPTGSEAAIVPLEAAQKQTRLEGNESYPGFENIGTIPVSRSNGTRAGYKTLHLSLEEAVWNDAYYHCVQTIIGGRLLTVMDQQQGETLFKLLVQHRLQQVSLYTAGVRDASTGKWRWIEPATFMPSYPGFWAPNEPNPDPSFDLATYDKSQFDFSIRTARSRLLSRRRYICEVL